MSTEHTASVRSLVEALEGDPFYQAITPEHSNNITSRRAILKDYFEYSMREGEKLGRCTVLPGDDRGAAVWLLPTLPTVQAEAKATKDNAFAALLGKQGYANYQRIIGFMAPRAEEATGSSAWYLSIMGVSPCAQGQGLGRKLLEPTLLEADRANVLCYLETFNPRSLHFYERLGFASIESHLEPVTAAEYWIMLRQPNRSTQQTSSDSR